MILDKDSGLFSRTAGGRVARMFGTKKFGHIGTLDPMASGVLIIALGNATKMIPFFEDMAGDKKEYLFSMQFGFETDTLDITGCETRRDDFIPDTNDVVRALAKQIGEIQQIPPMYSAVHVNGQRAYEIARQGKSIEIPARNVHIYELEFTGVHDKSWHFRVVCSRGTYVRSLGRDIAKSVGAIATVDMIRRVQSNGITIKNAVQLDFLENLVNNGGDLGAFVHPIDFGLGDIPVQNLNNKDAAFYKNGGFVDVASDDGLVRVYNDSEFIGIGVVTGGKLRPKRTI